MKDKMAEVEEQPAAAANGNGAHDSEDDESAARPVDIEQDMREMDRRKRVEAIMSSKLFREELERVVSDSIRVSIHTGFLILKCGFIKIEMREMERRKRVEDIMSSKLFRAQRVGASG